MYRVPMSPRRIFKLVVIACVVLQLFVVFQYGSSMFSAIGQFRPYSFTLNDTVTDAKLPSDDDAPTTVAASTVTKSVVVAKVVRPVVVLRTNADLKLENEAVEFMKSYNKACEKTTPPAGGVNMCPCTPPILYWFEEHIENRYGRKGLTRDMKNTFNHKLRSVMSFRCSCPCQF